MASFYAAIIGPRRSGKTTMLEKIVENYVGRVQMVVIDSVVEEGGSLIERCCAKYPSTVYELVRYKAIYDIVELTNKPLQLFDVSFLLERRNECRDKCMVASALIMNREYQSLLLKIFGAVSSFDSFMLLDEIKVPLQIMGTGIAATYHTPEECELYFSFANIRISIPTTDDKQKIPRLV